MEFAGLTTLPLIIVGLYGIAAFVVTLFRPVWGLYALVPIIGLGFEQSSVIKGGFLVLIFFAYSVYLARTRDFPKIPKSIFPFIVIVGAFMAWVFLRAVFGTEPLSLWIFWLTKRIVATSAVTLFALLVLKTKDDVWSFVKVLVFFGALTAFVAILQYMHISFAWGFRDALGIPESVAYQVEGRIRVSGLASFVIPLSYQLLSLIPLGVAWIIVSFRERRTALVPIFATVLMTIALVLSFVKAAIGGLFIGGVVMVIFFFTTYPSERKKIMVGVLVAVLLGACIAMVGPVRKQLFRFGDTTSERVPITLAALKVATRYPLGVGYTYSQKVELVYDQVKDLPGAPLALYQFPHSIIFGPLAILGFPALILIIIFYVYLFRALVRHGRVSDDRIRILALVGVGIFSGYLVNALFHNNNPFFGDAFNWLIMGLMFALINVEIREK